MSHYADVDQIELTMTDVPGVLQVAFTFRTTLDPEVTYNHSSEYVVDGDFTSHLREQIQGRSADDVLLRGE